MINKLAYTLTFYIKSNSDFENTDDLVKINYALENIINEVFKIIILIVLFSYLGKTNYLIFSMTILFSIRIFSGGLHSKTFLGCLMWTCLFFIITSLVVPILPKLNMAIYYLVSLFNILIIAKQSPYPNPYRAIKNKKRRHHLKMLAFFFTIFWTFILLFYISNISYLNCGIFSISLQSIQLLYIKKGVII